MKLTLGSLGLLCLINFTAGVAFAQFSGTGPPESPGTLFYWLQWTINQMLGAGVIWVVARGAIQNFLQNMLLRSMQEHIETWHHPKGP